MAIATETIGDWQGEPVTKATLRAGNLSLEAMNFGAVTTALTIRGRPLILGYDRFADYVDDPFYMGAIVGRVANRIAGAAYTHEGKTYTLEPNEGENALHGGANGYHKRLWKMEMLEAYNAVRFLLRSPDGDQGFPGEMEVSVTIRLEASALTYQISGTPSVPCPVNIAQHNYYNLGGDLMDHKLRIFADQYTPVDAKMIPTGQFAEASGVFDLRETQALRDVGSPAGALDHNYVLCQTRLPQVNLQGTRANVNLRTNLPGIQVYTGADLGEPFGPHHGICLEPQYFPNAVNEPNFPMPIHSKERPFAQVTRLEFVGEGDF